MESILTDQLIIEQFFKCFGDSLSTGQPSPLKGKCLNLDSEARKWSQDYREYFSGTYQELGIKPLYPLAEPGFCQTFIEEIHRVYDIDWSWGWVS